MNVTLAISLLTRYSSEWRDMVFQNLKGNLRTKNGKQTIDTVAAQIRKIKPKSIRTSNKSGTDAIKEYWK